MFSLMLKKILLKLKNLDFYIKKQIIKHTIFTIFFHFLITLSLCRPFLIFLKSNMLILILKIDTHPAIQAIFCRQNFLNFLEQNLCISLFLILFLQLIAEFSQKLRAISTKCRWNHEILIFLMMLLMQKVYFMLSGLNLLLLLEN